MSLETSKCYIRRYAQGHLQKLKGVGYDIGGGADGLRLPQTEVKLWDKKNGNGDAQILEGLENDSLDFLYSSHCLEHMKKPVEALNRWIEVVKSGGYIYIAVPDYDLYEGGKGIRNGFHKCAFTLDKKTDMKVPLYNIYDFLFNHVKYDFIIEYVALCDENYDYEVLEFEDQTRKQAVCHIEFMLKKR
jgi:ubiquinone/menaquinone biosynthesis C-methylase UbiE